MERLVRFGGGPDQVEVGRNLQLEVGTAEEKFQNMGRCWLRGCSTSFQEETVFNFGISEYIVKE